MVNSETRNQNILIVDDQTQNLLAIVDCFERNKISHNLLFAKNGEQGIELAKKTLPDLILLDWVMPGITGIEVVKKLSQDPETENIPVIIITGLKLEGADLKYALECGAIDFITKPFNELELIARTQSVLGLFDAQKKLVEREKQIEKLKSAHIENELQLTKQELLAAEIDMVRYTETIANLIATLEQFVEDDKDIDKSALRSSINTYKISQNETHWEALKIRLNQVHIGFMDRLQERYPSLTPRETQLCAFLRLNLSIKEISSITFQKEQSVKQARYRLRKSLNVEQDVNLVSFITSI